YGHTTENCRHLKDEIERLIRAGYLKEFMYHDRVKGKGKRRCREDSKERSDRDEEGDGQDGRGKKPRRDGDKGGHGGEAPMKRGTIYMIFGGPTDGDSNRARKEHARAVKRNLNAFQAVISMYHMMIKYPVGENVGEIAGDQLTSRSCYQTTVSNNKQLAKRQAESKGEEINRPGGSRSKEDKQKVEKGKEKMDIQPGEEVEEIQMIEGCEGRKFRIGKDLEEPIRSRLIQLVREFADIFPIQQR
ncbi:Unknown protein, partial [Striga hermonthica]